MKAVLRGHNIDRFDRILNLPKTGLQLRQLKGQQENRFNQQSIGKQSTKNKDKFQRNLLDYKRLQKNRIKNQLSLQMIHDAKPLIEDNYLSAYKMHTGKYFHHEKSFSSLEKQSLLKEKNKIRKKYSHRELISCFQDAKNQLLRTIHDQMRTPGQKYLKKQLSSSKISKNDGFGSKYPHVIQFIKRQKQQINKKQPEKVNPSKYQKSQSKNYISLPKCEQNKIALSHNSKDRQLRTLSILNRTILVEPQNYYPSENQPRRIMKPKLQLQLQTASVKIVKRHQMTKKDKQFNSFGKLNSIEDIELVNDNDNNNNKKQHKGSKRNTIITFQVKKNRSEKIQQNPTLSDIRGWDIEDEGIIYTK